MQYRLISGGKFGPYNVDEGKDWDEVLTDLAQEGWRVEKMHTSQKNTVVLDTISITIIMSKEE